MGTIVLTIIMGFRADVGGATLQNDKIDLKNSMGGSGVR
jgi:hypothetical protein